MSVLQSLQEKFGQRIKQDFILAPYTTFKMGGPAQYYFVAQTKEELIDAYKIAQKHNIPFFLLGGASNIVISEKGLKGLTVKNQISYKKIIQENNGGVIVEVGSGYSMTRLSKETSEDGLTGIEFHLGLPGTVGGAVYMNSKWTHPKAFIGDAVKSVEVLNKDGAVEHRTHSELNFKYGWSELQDTKEIILSVTFILKRVDPVISRQNAKNALVYRHETQPVGISSSGCFFKNDGDISAGKLIDEAGLKGFQLGNFAISDKHANFIINKGNGKEEDLKALLGIMKQRVKTKFNIDLKEEVVII